MDRTRIQVVALLATTACIACTPPPPKECPEPIVCPEPVVCPEVAAAQSGGEAAKLETDDQKTLYALGVALSGNLTAFDLSPEEIAPRSWI